jgi:hypothetical protein
MKQIRPAAFFIATLFLFGCATSSPIQRYNESESRFRNSPELISNDFADKDIYRVYHRASTGFVSIQSIRQSAEERAASFAHRQGKGIIVLGEKTSSPPYILGNFPRIELIFALSDKDQTAEPKPLSSKYDDLKKLKKLLDDGAITQAEFEAEKRKLLKN